MTKTDQAKERLRQHLTHLNATGYIDPYQLIRDKVYYYKEVISYLKHLGFINETGHLIHEFYPDTIINNIHQFKQKEPKQISPRRAKAIGSKMVKRTLQDAIDQNVNITIPLLEIEPEVKEDYFTPEEIERGMFEANQTILANFEDQELFDELKARGWSGELTKKTRV